VGQGFGRLIQQGTDALLAGRFRECERLAAGAAAADPEDPSARLLAVAACREQGRAAEAEILLRDLGLTGPLSGNPGPSGPLSGNPGPSGPLSGNPGPSGRSGDEMARAMLAALLADLGRDTDAGRQLETIDLETASLPVCALAAEVVGVLRLTPEAKILLRRLAPHAADLVSFHGSLSRHLGLVTHVLGDWSDAAEHFDVALRANRAAGAPVVVAHTSRHYSAVLRLRGRDGDWDQAIDLLAQAADIYRRLDIDVRAEDAESILRRSLDVADTDGAHPAGADALHRRGEVWALSYAGQSAIVADCAGLAYVTRLVSTTGRPVHVFELVGSPTEAALADALQAECRARLADLGRRPQPGPVGASLDRAERDQLQAELASLATGRLAPREMGDRSRRLVATRLRVALERIDETLPDLGRHLRRSIRTGTFCVYEPARLDGWRLPE